MNVEEEIKEITNAVNVIHREVFQANKLPKRLYDLEKRIEKIESKGKLGLKNEKMVDNGFYTSNTFFNFWNL